MSKQSVPGPTDVVAELTSAAERCRMIFFSGLPAAGKSLFLQQQAVLAAEAGRRIHFLRWDIALAPFQTDALLTRYPDTNSVTHPVIRKAAGLWSRQAVARWHAEFSTPSDLLIGEFPISGNRFVELVRVADDDAEPLLADDSAVFFVPVPSNEVRRRLVAKRQASISNPQHSDEQRDAPMHTLENVWRETRSLAFDLGLVDESETGDSSAYDSTIYRRFFQHLLRHRNSRILTIDEVYAGFGSAHDLSVEFHEVLASADEVAACIAQVDTAWSSDEITRLVGNWYDV